MLTLDDFRALPKVELHRHLEGSLPLPELWELRQRFDPISSSYDEFVASATVAPGEAPGFVPFLAKFDAYRFRYGTLENIERLAFLATQAAAADGVIYLEWRFSPVFFARRTLAAGTGVIFDSVEPVEAAAFAVIAGTRRAAAETGMRVEFILTCSRSLGLTVNRPALDLLHRPIAKEFCGLDLAGDEACDAAEFAPWFVQWREAGKGITIHAGEDARGDGPGSIRSALDVFDARRIGHGVRCLEDSALVKRLVDDGVPLELCPTSNLQTRAAASLAEYPLKALLENRVVATINTDDPTICGTTLSGEYLRLYDAGVNFESLQDCALKGVYASFMPDGDLNRYLKRIAQAWNAAPR